MRLYRYVTRTNVSFFDPSPNDQQDACTGVHSACRREEMCTTPSTAQAGADAGISWS